MKIFLGLVFNAGKSLICLLLILLSVAAMSSEYAVSNIPDDLKSNANVVYHVNNLEVNIRSDSQYTLKYEVVATILNENGRGAGVFASRYDSYSLVRFRGGEIFDKNGRSIERVRSRDLEDQSLIQGFSLYEDSRITYYVPRISNYPYTVRYEYEVSYSRGMYYRMTYLPANGYRQSAVKASLKIDMPEDFDFKYREFNLEEVKKATRNYRNRKEIVWEVENINAVRDEFVSPDFRDILPSIMFTKGEFEFDGYKGANTSWEDYGKWIWSLNEGKDKLPDETVSFLRELVLGLESDYDKAKKIYEYMQSRTRYVNIVLGIGGMQPFDAQTVDRTGYGDCKALTNYMYSMLKAVDIESYYTLVYAGRGEYGFFPDFVANQFNHAILCLPLENDTIWLECTSQNSPFGHIGSFTDNRHVLLIKEEGGVLAKTTAYCEKENSINSNAVVHLERNGHGTAEVGIEYGAHFFDNIHRASRNSPDEQLKWLYEMGYMPDYSIVDYSISVLEDKNPLGVVSMSAELRSYANPTESRLFVPLNLLSNYTVTPPRIRSRKNPFELKYERSYTDTITYFLPEGFWLEATIADFEIDTDFGSYISTVELNDNKLIYTRYLERKAGYFPPERYNEYFEFWQTVNRADSRQATFVQK